MSTLKFKKGFYADVRIEDRFTTNVRLQNGQLHEAKQTAEKKAFVRVYDGKMWYYTSTGDVDNVQHALDELYSYANENEEIEQDPIVKRYQVNKDKKIAFADTCVKNVPFEDKLKLLQATSDKLGSELCNFKQAIYLDRYSLYNFYSSKGADITYDFQTCGVAYAMAFMSGDDHMTEQLSKAKTDFASLAYSDEELSDFVKRCEDFVKNAKPVEAGSYPVVLAPIVTGVFAHESFGHKSEADFMLGDETMAREWTIGKKVGSDILTIRESGVFEGSGYVPYDDEGTKATDTYLIKNGVLAGRLHSATTAAALNEDLTGNARAINCDFEPIVRMTNTFVEAGDSTFEQLISGIKHGYYIWSIKHGSGMSTFTLAPNIAYEIIDGKLAGPVKIAVMTGNVFETLGLIDGVGNDKQLLSFVTGGCGKMEQYPLNVGMGGPHIRVSKMNIQ
ncbi:MAG: TldD/PmbA family protein [Corallococcus sp.]|nr:TldD/PmbA family protein [Corallococcus sp.]MCM1360146.1 TldD/PmbA family protein [Corallococcus sp.]MCM1395466.1 TldD/PmbA family protein [Corallococcus sp.]